MDQAQHLRNIVKYQEQRNISNAKVITITSGKGGVGKSNMAVNLAVHFRHMGKRVIIFDADFGLANVEVMFGTVPKYNLTKLLEGEMKIEDIITKGPEGIGFISGGSGIVGLNNLNKSQIDYLISNLSYLNELTDVLIIDTGAGVSDSVLEFVLASPEVVLVTTPEPSSLTDSYSLVKALYKNPGFIRNGTNIRLVANKVNSKAEAMAVYEKIKTVTSKFLNGDVKYLGMVPQDDTLEKAVRSQKIVSLTSPKAKSSKAFEEIAYELLEEKITYKWGISQIFSSFIK